MSRVVRTQIYLTEEEQQALRTLARRTGRSQSELIREAIDAMLAGTPAPDRRSLLRAGSGLWRDRDDLPDWGALRRELDRAAEP